MSVDHTLEHPEYHKLSTEVLQQMSGEPEARYQLGVRTSTDKLIVSAAEAGHPIAVAHMLLKKDPASLDHRVALELLDEAVVRGNITGTQRASVVTQSNY